MSKVGVVGCGLMGSGIAEVAARSGFDVLVVELDDGALAAGRRRIDTSLARAVRAGKLDDAGVEKTLSRIDFGTDFGAMADRQIIVEAVPEDEHAKLAVFETLDRVVEDD